jgi:putative transposase
VLLRLAYLTVTSAFAALRLLAVSDRDKDAEILALRHQITVLQRQLGATRPRFTPGDRAFLFPHRPPSPGSTSTGATASAASSTSTGMPLNLHG